MADMSEPRVYTPDEVRELFLEHARGLAKYWNTTDLSRQEFSHVEDEQLYRIEGALFSLFVTLDGGSMDLPGFQVIPYPDVTDQEFHQEIGENWFPFSPDNNNDIAGSLHELFHKKVEE